MKIYKSKKIKKHHMLLSSLQVAVALRAIGEKYDRKMAWCYRGILFIIALVQGLLFELNPIFWCVVIVVYMFCVPQIIFNQKKFEYETRRFNDINSYMSQMAQSFIYTQDVIKSLEETAACFSKGRMHDTLGQALAMIESGKWDVKSAERDALAFIEAQYDCERLINLHAFFLKAEELGGECQKEFKILESMRIAWQGVLESIRMKMYWDRNIGTGIYVFFLIICVIMLQIMKSSELDIVRLLPTQILDTVLLMGWMFYFLLMDKRLNKSLLIHPSIMSEAYAEACFRYLENYNITSERKKYVPFSVLSIIVAGLLVYILPSWVTVAIALCIILIGFNVHIINHISVVWKVKAEINKAFPKWLFSILLLLQRESVEGAIEASVKTAPPVLKRELIRFTEALSVKPHDPDAYMSFLKDYGNQNINEIMHKLYSLAIGANRDREILDIVMEENIKGLEKAERDSMMFKDSMKSFIWIPFLCAGFGCMGYLVIAIVTSINEIIQLVS